jgi:hypothetical protein
VTDSNNKNVSQCGRHLVVLVACLDSFGDGVMPFRQVEFAFGEGQMTFLDDTSSEQRHGDRKILICMLERKRLLDAACCSWQYSYSASSQDD